MAQRQSLRLPTQEAQFWSLVWGDPACRGPAEPTRHHYAVSALEPGSRSPEAQTPEPLCTRREAPAMRGPQASAKRSPQRHTAREQLEQTRIPGSGRETVKVSTRTHTHTHAHTRTHTHTHAETTRRRKGNSGTGTRFRQNSGVPFSEGCQGETGEDKEETELPTRDKSGLIHQRCQELFQINKKKATDPKGDKGREYRWGICNRSRTPRD